MDQRFEYKRQHLFFSEFLRYLEEFDKKRINLPHSADMDHVKVLTLASHLSLQLSDIFVALATQTSERSIKFSEFKSRDVQVQFNV